MTRRRRPRTSEERLVAAVGSVARGVVGGRIRNVRQAPALVRNTGDVPSTGGGFDPNADPVVIGNAANGNSQSGGVAIGASAKAISTSAIAIGKSAAAVAYGVAVGELAATQSDEAIAVGRYANVHLSANRGTAVGYAAGVRNFHAHSTALGAEANTTAANQVMLGTASDFVEIPGDSSTAANGLVLTDTDGSGTRWLIQVTGGSIVLSAAP